MSVSIDVTGTKKLFDKLGNLKGNLKNYLKQDVGPLLRDDYEDTTANWSSGPAFIQVYKEPLGTRLQLDVFPKGKGTVKWKRVSDGTGPRIIHAKPGKMMIFKRNYDPKTTPGGKWGGSGRRHGSTWIAKQVRHESAPREFSIKIKDKRENQIFNEVVRVVRKTLT